MRFIGENMRTNICDGWGYRKQHGKVVSSEPTGSSGGRLVPIEAREICIQVNQYWMQTDLREGIALDKAASSYQEQVLERTWLWALRGQHSWQGREWVPHPEGGPGWHSLYYNHPIAGCISYSSLSNLMQLFFFLQSISCVCYLFVCLLFPTRIKHRDSRNFFFFFLL